MTLKKSSNKFAFTVRDTARPLWFLTIPYLILEIFKTVNYFFDTYFNNYDGFGNLIKYVKPAIPEDGSMFYYQCVDQSIISYFFCIIWACTFAMVAFSYLTSKKKSNVYMSLGISRRDMFFGRFIGGLLPIVSSVVIGYLVNLVMNFVLYPMTAELVSSWFFDMFSMLFTLLCAYSVAVLAFVNAGNVVEAIVFTAIFGASSPIIAPIIEKTIGGLVFGSAYGTDFYNAARNYSQKLWFLDIFGSYTETIRVSDTHTSTIIGETGKQAVLGIITGAIAFILITVLAYLLFRKRSSETAGTILKSYNLYRIFFVILSFLAFSFALSLSMNLISLSRYVGFALATVAAVLCILIGILIFTRKMPLKIMACAAAFYVGFSICCFIGYNKSMPKAENVKSVNISSGIYDPYIKESGLNYLYESQAFAPERYYFRSYDRIRLTDPEDIKWIMDIHKDIVNDGYISKPGKDSATTKLVIEYVLKDGKTVQRAYNVVSSQVYEKLLGFNKTVKGTELNEYSFKIKKANADETVENGSDDMLDYGDRINKYFGFWTEGLYNIVDIEKAVPYCDILLSDKEYDVCVVDPLGKHSSQISNVSDEKSKEFEAALEKDLKNQTVEQRYFHSADDELCLLRLSEGDNYSNIAYYYTLKKCDSLIENGSLEDVMQSVENLLMTGMSIKSGDSIFDEKYDDSHWDDADRDVYIFGKESYEFDNYVSLTGKEPKKGDFEKFADEIMKFYNANKFEADSLLIDSGFAKYQTEIVVTKDMVNTIKFLEENGVSLKNMENKEKIVSATITKFDDCIAKVEDAEGVIKTSDRYSIVRVSQDYLDSEYSKMNSYGYEPRQVFSDSKITDAQKIRYLFENSQLYYGKAFGNYIVEFILEDGTRISKVIKAELVKDLI